MPAEPRALSAALFDMDGLLVDTEPTWTVAEVELARRLGGEFTPEIKAAIVGTRIETAVPIMLTALGHAPTPELAERTMAELLARMVELYRGELVPLPGAVELVAELRAAGVPLALVSSSYRVLVDAVVERLGLRFDLVLAGDEVRHAKPHPEPYLTACDRLGAALIIDDVRCGGRHRQRRGGRVRRRGGAERRGGAPGAGRAPPGAHEPRAGRRGRPARARRLRATPRCRGCPC